MILHLRPVVLLWYGLWAQESAVGFTHYLYRIVLTFTPIRKLNIEEVIKIYHLDLIRTVNYSNNTGMRMTELRISRKTSQLMKQENYPLFNFTFQIIFMTAINHFCNFARYHNSLIINTG
jgi:hypothetical protein